MKRGTKLLALSLALLILCCAATGLVNMDFDEEYEETPDTSATLWELDSAAVTGLGWENLSEDALSFTYSDAWAYDGDAAFPLDSAMIDSILAEICTLTASRTIEEPEEAAQYGLNEPLSVITLTTAEGSYTLQLGDETALGGERYASTGDGKVYLVDAALLDSFDYGLYDLVLEEELPDLADITGITIDAEVNQMTLAYLENSGPAYSDSYTWFLKNEDGYTALDPELTEDLLYYFRYFAWVECVNYQAGEDDLARYGLDTPTATLTVEYDASYLTDTGEVDENGDAVYETTVIPSTLVLEIGSYDDTSCCNARIAGSEMIYLIDAAVSDAILYTTADTLLPDEVLVMDWENVTSMDITLDGEVYTIHWGTEATTDDEGNTTEKTVYHWGDTQVWMDDTMNILDGMAFSGYATGITPERSEEIRLVIHRENENFPDVEIVFYQYDSTKCLVQLMGESTVFTAREDVVALIEEINSMVLD